MKFKVPNSELEFEVPDEWWTSAGMKDFVPISECYPVKQANYSEIVSVEDVAPPSRTEGQREFRNRESVIAVLRKMRTGEELEPIEVWSKEKTGTEKYSVRNGYHRFYLSIAAGYRKLPINVNDFDVRKFLDNERRGARQEGPEGKTDQDQAGRSRLGD